MRRMCELADVSRAGFYRFSPKEKGKADIELRDAMQRAGVEGQPRIEFFEEAL